MFEHDLRANAFRVCREGKPLHPFPDHAAAAQSYHVGSHIAERLYPGQVLGSPQMLLELPFAVAVPKGKRADLLARLNAGTAEIRADGTWHQINEHWRSVLVNVG